MQKRARDRAAIASIVAALGWAHVTRAETWSAPATGKAFAVPGSRVVCAAPSGWVFDAARDTLRPPDHGELGATADARVATDSAGCATASQPVTLRVIAPPPSIEPGAVVLAVDDAALELRGRRLQGLHVRWRAGGSGDPGDAACDAATDDACRAPVDPHGLAPGARFAWLPAGASGADDEVLFDAEGRTIAPEQRRLAPARVALAMLVRPD